jgi:hypothetical protein
VFTLSALLGEGSDWDRLVPEWEEMIALENERLVRQGRPKISRYHASECNACDNEFDGWSSSEQVEFTKKMHAILKAHQLKTISFSIDLKDLEAAIPGNDLIGSAYAIGTLFLVYNLGVWLDEKRARPETRLTLIHDRCDYDEEILARFNELKSDPGFKQSCFFTTCAPMGCEDCTPLQAADLFAYENMKNAEGRLENRKIRKSFDLILTEGTTGIKNLFMDASSIETMKPFIDGMRLPISEKARKRGMGDGRYRQFSAAMDTVSEASEEAPD